LQSNERGLPIGAEAVEGTEYNFRKPRRIGSTVLDHAFTNLERDQDGLARVELRDPDRKTQVFLWVDQSYSYLMLFSGDPLPNVRRRSLAVEPMTCPPNAFRTGDALIRLEPGSSFMGTWGITRGNARRR
jgi:aldose 1-epimerase